MLKGVKICKKTKRIYKNKSNCCLIRNGNQITYDVSENVRS